MANFFEAAKSMKLNEQVAKTAQACDIELLAHETSAYAQHVDHLVFIERRDGTAANVI